MSARDRLHLEQLRETWSGAAVPAKAAVEQGAETAVQQIERLVALAIQYQGPALAAWRWVGRRDRRVAWALGAVGALGALVVLSRPRRT